MSEFPVLPGSSRRSAGTKPARIAPGDSERIGPESDQTANCSKLLKSEQGVLSNLVDAAYRAKGVVVMTTPITPFSHPN
jgi:hypothetical protein